MAEVKANETVKQVTIHEHTDLSDGLVSWEYAMQYWFNNDYEYCGPADHHHIATKKLVKVLMYQEYLKKHPTKDVAFADLPKTELQIYENNAKKQLNKAYFELSSDAFAGLTGMKVPSGKTIKYINACEFTARDSAWKNDKGRPAKYHFLIVAPRLDTDNLFKRLLQLKRINDIDYTRAHIEYMYRYKGLKDKFPADKINEFIHNKQLQGINVQALTEKLTEEFFQVFPEEKNVLASSNREFKRMMNAVPDMERLDIPFDVLLAAAHDAGAFVLMAHPARNLRRLPENTLLPAIQSFIDRGVDGFCINEVVDISGTNDKYLESKPKMTYGQINTLIGITCNSRNKIIEIERKRHTRINKNTLIIDGGGNDCHTREHYENLSKSKFNTKSAEMFVDAIEELNYARELGLTTNRIYDINTNIVEDYIAERLYIDETGKPYSHQYRKFTKKMKVLEAREETVREIKQWISENSELLKMVKSVELSNGLEVSGEWLKIVNTNKNLTLEQYEALKNGESPTKPKAEGSVKETKDRMVSKDAAVSHSGGREM
ncbi:MAG: hypothetical protein J6X00_03140 [Clostridia bacterium]|nr:hypothetical protein [Clostridia bacterium]